MTELNNGSSPENRRNHLSAPLLPSPPQFKTLGTAGPVADTSSLHDRDSKYARRFRRRWCLQSLSFCFLPHALLPSPRHHLTLPSPTCPHTNPPKTHRVKMVSTLVRRRAMAALSLCCVLALVLLPQPTQASTYEVEGAFERSESRGRRGRVEGWERGQVGLRARRSMC